MTQIFIYGARLGVVYIHGFEYKVISSIRSVVGKSIQDFQRKHPDHWIWKIEIDQVSELSLEDLFKEKVEAYEKSQQENKLKQPFSGGEVTGKEKKSVQSTTDFDLTYLPGTSIVIEKERLKK